MAWFWTIIQSFIRLSASFLSYDMKKCYMEFDTKLEDWIKRYLIETYHRLSQEYFKSYRITFRAALWIVSEQLSSYLFVYWLLFEFTAEKYHLHFDSKLKDWINRYLVETWERLSQEYIKSYRIAFRVALWLVFELFSSYLIVNRRLFGVTVSNLYMVLGPKLKYWIKRYLVETWHRSFQEYFKSYKIAFRVALRLDFGQSSC